MAEWVDAVGIVLSAGETGVLINDQPQIRLEVAIRPVDRPPYKVRLKKMVSLLSLEAFQPGAALPLKVSPPQSARREAAGQIPKIWELWKRRPGRTVLPVPSEKRPESAHFPVFSNGPRIAFPPTEHAQTSFDRADDRR